MQQPHAKGAARHSVELQGLPGARLDDALTLADLRISLARRSSRTSPRRRLSSSRSSLLKSSLRGPASASAWRTRFRSVSGWMLGSAATWAIGGPDSNTRADAAGQQLLWVFPRSWMNGDSTSSRTESWFRSLRQTRPGSLRARRSGKAWGSGRRAPVDPSGLRRRARFRRGAASGDPEPPSQPSRSEVQMSASHGGVPRDRCRTDLLDDRSSPPSTFTMDSAPPRR